MAHKPIKDQCRQGLIPYLQRALDNIPDTGPLVMLDAGCGSGIPTVALAGRFDGHIYGLDPDAAAIESLRQAFAARNWQHRLTTQLNMLEINAFQPDSFDLILAEGLLNITGFDTGFAILDHWLKPEGWCILHDEFKNQDEKFRLMQNTGYSMLYTELLDEHCWWNSYYSCLEAQLKQAHDTQLYATEHAELEMFRQQPSLFRSVYYVVRKNK